MRVRDLKEILNQYDDDYFIEIATGKTDHKESEENLYEIEIIKQVDENTVVLKNSELLSVMDRVDIVENLQNHLIKMTDIDVTTDDFTTMFNYLEKSIDEIIYGY